MLAVDVLAATDCALCGTRPNRSGDLSDHSLIPGWEEVGFDSCAGELIYANTRRPGRTTFKRPAVPSGNASAAPSGLVCLAELPSATAARRWSFTAPEVTSPAHFISHTKF